MEGISLQTLFNDPMGAATRALTGILTRYGALSYTLATARLWGCLNASKCSRRSRNTETGQFHLLFFLLKKYLRNVFVLIRRPKSLSMKVKIGKMRIGPIGHVSLGFFGLG